MTNRKTGFSLTQDKNEHIIVYIVGLTSLFISF